MSPGRGARDGCHVALLRGINLGGKNKLAMRDLVGLFAAAGCTDVQTYIQSGNVVFRATEAVAATLAGTIRAAIEREHGLKVPVVLRAAEELGRVAQVNPFLGRDGDTEALHVMFLDGAPSAAAIASLDSRRSPPDEFVVVGREVYLRCPNGLGRSKLGNDYFDRKLATISTVRNWRTVLRLIAMSAGSGDSARS